MPDQKRPESVEPTPGTSRREFIQRAAFVGAGLLAVPAVAGAQQIGTMAGQPVQGGSTPPPAAVPAVAAVPPAKAKAKGLTLDKVLAVAREKLYPRCRVCPECDGVACSGEVPGFGGIGSGMSFKNNYNALQRVHLKMRTCHDVHKPDLRTTLFGHPLAFPITSAVTGGTTYNMGGRIGEEEYVDAILGGCLQAGTIGWVADGIEDDLDVFKRRLKVLAATFRGQAIVVIKPKSQEEIIKRVHMVEEAGAIAWAIDIDSAGRAARAVPGQTVEPKTPAKLRELVKCSKLPFIVKGIMTVEEAQLAVDCGAAGIGVSNHGGRVLDHTPGVAEALPPIAAKLKGKTVLLADGAVRYGADALKLLALGADVVLVGRPLVRGAHGAGRDGVALILDKMKSELTDSMVLTGTPDIRSISRSILA